MTVYQMRQALHRFYGDKWYSRVQKMSDKQVQAIYLKFKREGKIK